MYSVGFAQPVSPNDRALDNPDRLITGVVSDIFDEYAAVKDRNADGSYQTFM